MKNIKRTMLVKSYIGRNNEREWEENKYENEQKKKKKENNILNQWIINKL